MLDGKSSLFILYIIVMWQGLKANQIALFQECVVHPVFIFYFSANGAKKCGRPSFDES